MHLYSKRSQVPAISVLDPICLSGYAEQLMVFFHIDIHLHIFAEYKDAAVRGGPPPTNNFRKT